LAVSDRAGEGMGILVTRIGNNEKVKVKGVFYVTPSGEYFTVMLGQQGYPETLTSYDGTTISFSNYTQETVDLTFLDTTDSPIGSYHVELNDDFQLLKDLIEENGLTFPLVPRQIRQVYTAITQSIDAP